MSHALTVAALFIATFIGIALGVVEESTSMAYKKGSMGVQFGDSCLRTFPMAGWLVADKKNFTMNLIVTCSNDGCSILDYDDIRHFFKSPDGGESILLELIPAVDEIHANKYSCRDKYLSGNAKEFEYVVTVYDDKLSCSSNVTQHKAGDTLVLKCGIAAWGEGKADLEFQILSKTNQVVEEGRLKPVTVRDREISSTLLLDKSLQGNRIACNLKGFDNNGVNDDSRVDPCIVNGKPLNILYPPEFTYPFPYFRFATSGAEQPLNCTADANPAAKLEYVDNLDQAVGGSLTNLTEGMTSLTCKATNDLATVISTMQINFLNFVPSIPLQMRADESSVVSCGLSQSNLLNEAGVWSELHIGSKLITLQTSKVVVVAKKEWNEQAVVCVAKEKDDTGNLGKELLRHEAGTLSVYYGPDITCSEQPSASDYTELLCFLEQNPLSGINDVEISPDTAEIQWVKETEQFRRIFLVKIKRTVSAENKKESVSISVGGVVTVINYGDGPTKNGIPNSTLIAIVVPSVMIPVLVVLVILVIKRHSIQHYAIGSSTSTVSVLNMRNIATLD